MRARIKLNRIVEKSFYFDFEILTQLGWTKTHDLKFSAADEIMARKFLWIEKFLIDAEFKIPEQRGRATRIQPAHSVTLVKTAYSRISNVDSQILANNWQNEEFTNCEDCMKSGVPISHTWFRDPGNVRASYVVGFGPTSYY